MFHPIIRANVQDTADNFHLKKCRYNESLEPYCPIFRLGDIVNQTGHSFQDMALKVSFHNLKVYLLLLLLLMMVFSIILSS